MNDKSELKRYESSATESPAIKSPEAQIRYIRRAPAIAALMSTALPGFGQLYNGQVNRAIWFFLIFSLVTVPLVVLVAKYLPAAMMIGVLAVSVLLALAVWLWGIIDAWHVARRSSPYRIKPWQTAGLYTTVLLLCGFLVLPSVWSYVRNHQLQAFRTPSGSMMPTVQPGDFIWANMNYNCPNCRSEVKRGDVAIFVYPNNRNRHYIKRIIGLPGDTVTAEGRVLSINGEALSLDTPGSIVEEQMENRKWIVNAGDYEDFSLTVKPGHVFVLGDNRNKSNDSRMFGQVPLADVLGRARQIWFSRNENGVQWGRLGLSLLPEEKSK